MEFLNGSERVFIIQPMTKSKGIGRGNNPASHKNKPKLGDEQVRFHVCLLPHQKKAAKQLGNGSQSEGMRKALDLCSRDYSRLPPAGKLTVILLQAQSASESERSRLIAEALDYLESWSVERSWEKMKAETVTKTKGGAYII